jgi:hypothetical protein
MLVIHDLQMTAVPPGGYDRICPKRDEVENAERIALQVRLADQIRRTHWKLVWHRSSWTCIRGIIRSLRSGYEMHGGGRTHQECTAY